MPRRIRTLALALAAVSVVASAGGSAAGWEAKDISVVETVPGQKGSIDTRLEVGANGDARISVDIHDGDSRTKGTILLVAGRWMLTKGLTPKPGEEIDLMDMAALNSQLVVALLNAALPKGPPEAGVPRHILYAEKTKPVRVATTSASGEYGSPWRVEGTVSVSAPAAPATFHLSFTFSADGRTATLILKGYIGTPDSPISFPDSMTLADWAIHKIGPYQEKMSDGTRFDYGAQPQQPKARTIGELRKLYK